MIKKLIRYITTEVMEPHELVLNLIFIPLIIIALIFGYFTLKGYADAEKMKHEPPNTGPYCEIPRPEDCYYQDRTN